MNLLDNRPARLVAAAAALALVQGCATPPQMYMWGAFPHAQYDTLRGDGQVPQQQIPVLEEQAQKAAAQHAALPPGFRAHLGMLYLDAGDAAKARSLLLAEKDAFPESAGYIDHLLKRLDGPATVADKQGAPS